MWNTGPSTETILADTIVQLQSDACVGDSGTKLTLGEEGLDPTLGLHIVRVFGAQPFRGPNGRTAHHPVGLFLQPSHAKRRHRVTEEHGPKITLTQRLGHLSRPRRSVGRLSAGSGDRNASNDCRLTRRHLGTTVGDPRDHDLKVELNEVGVVDLSPVRLIDLRPQEGILVILLS